MKRFGMMAMSALVVAGMLAGCGKGEKQGGAAERWGQSLQESISSFDCSSKECGGIFYSGGSMDWRTRTDLESCQNTKYRHICTGSVFLLP